MEFKNLFEKFNTEGKLLLPSGVIECKDLAWNAHPTFEGVALKHIITSKQTQGACSYHFVKIDPGKKIDMHVHEEQLETHEVISGSGTCINNGVVFNYVPGSISIFQANTPHEIIAEKDGIYLFAKFIPALL